jgi:hypothetical protein
VHAPLRLGFCFNRISSALSLPQQMMGAYCFCGASKVIGEPPLPFPVRLCDNLEGFVTLSCRNLEAFLFCSLLF